MPLHNTDLPKDRVHLSTSVIARNHKPHYVKPGLKTIHDDDIARRNGYAGALVSGIVVAAYAMPTIVRTWGADWCHRGTIRTSFKRPVYDGKTLDLEFDFFENDEGRVADITCRQAGEVVVTGKATLPGKISAPDLAPFNAGPQPFPDVPIRATEEHLRAGLPFGSEYLNVDRETVAQLTERLDLAPGDWPAGLFHPFIFLNIATMYQHRSMSFPTPGIHASSSVQMLAPVEIGTILGSVGIITRVYEEKGHGFFEAAQLIQTREGRPVALVTDAVIYRPRNARVPS